MALLPWPISSSGCCRLRHRRSCGILELNPVILGESRGSTAQPTHRTSKHPAPQARDRDGLFIQALGSFLINQLALVTAFALMAKGKP